MRRFVNGLLLLILLTPGLVGSLAVPARAGTDSTGPHIVSVRLGFDGKYKVGHWTPVWIEIAAGGEPLQGRLEIRVPDGDGVPTRFFNQDAVDIDLPANATATFPRYIKPGRFRGNLTVRVRGNDEILCEQTYSSRDLPEPLHAHQDLFVTYGPSIGVEDAIAQVSREGREPTTACRLEDASCLPSDWIGYEGVSAIALSTYQLGPLEALQEAQWEALLQWLQMGGRLILCVGANGRELMAADSQLAHLADVVPGRFVNVIGLRDVSALETFAGTAQRLEATPRNGSQLAIRMTLLEETQGAVELGDTGPSGYRPMIVRWAYGLGQVVFVAFDLDVSPFAEWEGRARIVAQILEPSSYSYSHSAGGRSPQSGRVAHLGYEDLTGQLRSALDQFGGVSLIAFSLIAVLALVYIALIGPGDFFFLKQVLKRMQWTWFTFPIVVLLFVGITVLLNLQFKGRRLRTNQVDVVDVDTRTEFVRGTMWAHVYSPETRAYDFQLRPHVPSTTGSESGSILSWQGLPGTGLGGLNTTTRVASFSAPYSLVRTSDTSTTMVAAPIQVASTKSLMGRWWGRMPVQGDARLERATGGLLRGEVVNPLDVELTDCMVLYGNWAYRLERKSGKLAPGQSTRVEWERPFNLEWRLMRRSVRETNETTVPWDPTDENVPRIMEIMMFHKASGGANYTRLTNRYQGYIDLTDHLTSGCAILLGRSEQRATELILDGGKTSNPYDRHWTFYRIVFPVDETPTKDRDRD
ncbi:MAG: hypothetical protein ACC628_21235 [Pirellulaceae bacterium]